MLHDHFAGEAVKVTLQPDPDAMESEGDASSEDSSSESSEESSSESDESSDAEMAETLEQMRQVWICAIGCLQMGPCTSVMWVGMVELQCV